MSVAVEVADREVEGPAKAGRADEDRRQESARAVAPVDIEARRSGESGITGQSCVELAVVIEIGEHHSAHSVGALQITERRSKATEAVAQQHICAIRVADDCVEFAIAIHVAQSECCRTSSDDRDDLCSKAALTDLTHDVQTACAVNADAVDAAIAVEISVGPCRLK